MEFLFILRYLSFLSVSVKRCEKITKEGVDQGVAHSTYYVTQAAVLTCTHRLSTVVLNSRDCHENLWLPNFLHF